MSLLRSVEPELLDHMPADDARAVAARRGLKRINAVILQTGIMTRLLAEHWGDGGPRTILDLGTGDGTFTLAVARRLAARWTGVTVTLLDRQSIVSQETKDAFTALGWKAEAVAADVFAYLDGLKTSSVDIITTNLFLHHFQQEQLARLLALAGRAAQLVVACEPRRNKFALRASRLLWAIGCNEVALHDAIVSVRAGFGGQELSALWPSQGGFALDEHAARLFTHCFVARRKDRA
ncbi:MAG TPA: methyltransferase domain-containing protein [Xanthobacteraceae bacterium]